MAREIWLRPNRRAQSTFALGTATMLVGSVFVIWTSPGKVVMITVALAIVPLAYLLGVFLYSLYQPRLAYQDGQLLVYLRSGGPIHVPIEIVECFFLGQGDSLLPHPLFRGQKKPPETSTVVVRLAESAEEWKQVEVQPYLGHWCEGYITIRGTWCEPLSGDLVKQLNDRLVQVQRDARQQNEEEGA